MAENLSEDHLQFMKGGGEAGALIRSLNWEDTPLGHPSTWPACLRIGLNICLNSSLAMAIYWGPDYHLFYNDAYMAIAGDRHPGIMGKPRREAWPETWEEIRPQFDALIATGNSIRNQNKAFLINRFGFDEECYFDYTLSPITDENGNICGVLNAVIETTQQVINEKKEKLIIEQIKYSEDQLQFAIDAADLATWDLNPITNRFTGNNRLKSWFGMEPDAEVHLSRAMEVIAEIDRPLVLSAIQEAMTFSSGGNYYIEYAILNPLDPTPRIVRAKGKALFDNEQKVTRFSGTLQDITAERKILDALEHAYEQARLSKEAAQLGTFDMDLLKGTLEWDERCRLLFGISHKNEVSYENDFLPGLHPLDQLRINEVINKAFIKAESNGDYDVEYRTVGSEDKQLRWIRAKGKVFFNEQDEPVRFVGSVLEITNEKLNEIRKNDFIGMVSHELKTPLTSLKAYIQVLNARSKKEENSFAVSSLNKVELQINKMSALINGFLNLSRLESGTIHLHRVDFRMDELITELIEESLMVISTHRIELVSCEVVIVNADRDKIGQVITNLISNAVKYSPRGDLVELECKCIDNIVQVSVRDDGMGIRDQDKDKLFDRFYRVESVHTENISGFGIGLYLSAEIIKRHGGEIWVESEKGVGSTFHFSLPL